MRISHVQNYQNNNKYSQHTFGAWSRDVYKTDKSGFYQTLLHRNNTCFFRDDSFWVSLTNFLEKKYARTSKVNVYCYGCSDGSEPYSFVMQAMSKGDKFVKKFLPINASDYDTVAIEKAKENKYCIRPREYHNIKECTGIDPAYFFKFPFRIANYFQLEKYNASLQEKVVKNVKYSVKDILEDYKNIEKDNSVILARNFWPYIEDSSKRMKFFNDLYNHLGKNSFLVIGNFDNTNPDIAQEIMRAGFKRINNNTFEKYGPSSKKINL